MLCQLNGKNWIQAVIFPKIIRLAIRNVRLKCSLIIDDLLDDRKGDEKLTPCTIPETAITRRNKRENRTATESTSELALLVTRTLT